jgi:hypothetical protein
VHPWVSGSIIALIEGGNIRMRVHLRLRTAALLAFTSIASLGLIGVGVHATFTSLSSGGATLTMGTPAFVLTGSCINGTTCAGDPGELYSLTSDGSVLTFTSTSPSEVSFTSGDEQIIATNTGDLSLTDPTWVLNAVPVSSSLEGEAYVCATSTGIGSGGTNYLLYNGPLSGFTGTSYSLASDTLTTAGSTPTATTGPTDNFVVDVYAGSEPTDCGTGFTNGTGDPAGDGVATSVGSVAAPGTSTAPILGSDSSGESIAISAAFTYQS